MQGPAASDALPVDADLLRAGAQRVGPWRLEAVLGQGATSIVYDAVHVVDARRRALKVQRVAGGAASLRLRREGVLQLRLRHPNLIAVEEVIELDGRIALVTERIDGLTLSAWTQQALPVPLPRARAVIGALLEGLDAAHRGGVIHRDLKPDNVLVTEGDRPLLGDFGTAKQLGEATDPIVTVAGTPMGTPGFMAPEQWADASGVGPRADLFSWGAVAFFVLTGRPAFAGPDPTALLRASLDGRQQDLLALRPDCPAPLAAVIASCLSIHPAMRPASVAAIRRAIDGSDGEAAVPDTLLPPGALPAPSGTAPTDAPQPPDFAGRAAAPRSGAQPGPPELPGAPPSQTAAPPAAPPDAPSPRPPDASAAARPAIRPRWWIIAGLLALCVAVVALVDSPAQLPLPAETPSPAPAAPAPAATAPAAAEAQTAPRCATLTGPGRLGWFWSESKPPRALRRTMRLDTDTNVRAEASSEAAVICVLARGSRVRPSEPAVEVGDHYWVPFALADLRSP